MARNDLARSAALALALPAAARAVVLALPAAALALALPAIARAAQPAAPAVAKQVQQVVLPLPQYEALRARANPAPETVPSPPAPYAVESDEVEVQAGPAAAKVVQEITLTLYSGDWQTVALGEAGSFLSARLGDLEGRVVASGGGLGDLRVRGQGRHRVRLESVVAVVRDEGATRPAWRFAVRLPAAAVVRGSLAAAGELAPAVEEAELAGGLAEPEEGRGAGARRWRFAAPPGAALRVTLLGKPAAPARAGLPLRFTAATAAATVVTRTRARVHGWVEARVAQGRLAELAVALPAGFEVVAAKGPVAAWKVVGGELLLTPLAPVEDALAVELELEGTLSGGFELPLLPVRGAARETLLGKAALAGDGMLRLVETGSARPAEPGEQGGLGAAVREAPGQLYRVLDRRRPPRWQPEWADRTAVLAAEIDGLWVEVVAGDAGRASYRVWAAVRNRGAQQLAVRLPAGFELAEASREGERIVPGLASQAAASAAGAGQGKTVGEGSGAGAGTPNGAGTRGSLAGGAAGAGGAGESLVVPLLTREAPQVIHLAGVVPLALPGGGGELVVPLPALSAPAARVDARLLLPAGRSYLLGDPARAGSSGPPPRVDAEAKPASAIGRELASRRGPAAGVAALPFPRPAGFAELLASWSALSADPAPLVIRVKSAKEDNPWF
jgi:hypothetical protein